MLSGECEPVRVSSAWAFEQAAIRSRGSAKAEARTYLQKQTVR